MVIHELLKEEPRTQGEQTPTTTTPTIISPAPTEKSPNKAMSTGDQPTNTKRGEANDDATSVATDNNELETSFKSRRKAKMHQETEINSVNKNQTRMKS